MAKFEMSDKEWKERLGPERYAVLRKAATERPGTGPLLHEKGVGTFMCAGCGNLLFRSDAKYESGCGWPSFWDPITPGAVTEVKDHSLGMRRIEVRCGQCDSHLGHVFEDGPPPTGLRFCMNSLAMEFAPEASTAGGSSEGG
jgi:peptide-methionine (R)-S-oxide reductase